MNVGDNLPHFALQREDLGQPFAELCPIFAHKLEKLESQIITMSKLARFERLDQGQQHGVPKETAYAPASFVRHTISDSSQKAASDVFVGLRGHLTSPIFAYRRKGSNHALKTVCSMFQVETVAAR